MQQYIDMKSENPDAVLLFRLGDFYECFFGDAIKVSKALDLVLTRRGTDERGVEIPMCGIPWHAADNYFARLVRQNIPVAISEQMESPIEAKARGHKYIERKLVRVLTAGTLTDDGLLNPKKSNYLAAVAGNRICAADISTGELLIGESDDLLDDLSRLDAAEVLFDEDEAEIPAVLQIRAAFNCARMNRRQYDNFECGDSLAEKMLRAYLRQTQKDSDIKLGAPKKLGGLEARLSIDANSWKSLEIDAPLNAGGSTLLDIIDMTKSAAGARLIRRWLLALSNDEGVILKRQDHIGHLLNNPNVLRDLSGLLSRTPDIGRAFARLSSGRGMPRDLTCALNFLQILPSFKIAGASLDDDLAARFGEMDAFDGLAAELFLALSDNMPAFFRDGGVIKKGYDPELDALSNKTANSKSVIAKLQKEYAETMGANVKIKFNNVIGYFVEVAAKNADKFMAKDSGFIHRQTMSDNLRFTTTRLAELDSEIRNANDMAADIEQRIIANLIKQLSSHSDDIIKTAELLAEIDVLCALAEVAEEWGWVKPEIVKEPVFNVVGGRHPVVEKFLKEHQNQFVKNDCALGGNAALALLTGPNMSGKSTYLRANALIVILAHLGSFVPADKAVVGIADQLFSRVGASDNLASGQSTFMVEMVETANILNRGTRQSFIIFDEIGRGTATFDGMAIAEAVLEHTSRLKARCLFATHYHELTDRKLDGVQNLTIRVAESDGEIVFLHKIAPGVANRSYGIHVAKMAGMPDAVVKRAEQILEKLEQRVESTTETEDDEAESGQLSLF
jgi:DNA mismatch repair protein MutS